MSRYQRRNELLGAGVVAEVDHRVYALGEPSRPASAWREVPKGTPVLHGGNKENLGAEMSLGEGEAILYNNLEKVLDEAPKVVSIVNITFVSCVRPRTFSLYVGDYFQ